MKELLKKIKQTDTRILFYGCISVLLLLATIGLSILREETRSRREKETQKQAEEANQEDEEVVSGDAFYLPDKTKPVRAGETETEDTKVENPNKKSGQQTKTKEKKQAAQEEVNYLNLEYLVDYLEQDTIAGLTQELEAFLKQEKLEVRLLRCMKCVQPSAENMNTSFYFVVEDGGSSHGSVLAVSYRFRYQTFSIEKESRSEEALLEEIKKSQTE